MDARAHARHAVVVALAPGAASVTGLLKPEVPAGRLPQDAGESGLVHVPGTRHRPRPRARGTAGGRGRRAQHPTAAARAMSLRSRDTRRLRATVLAAVLVLVLASVLVTPVVLLMATPALGLALVLLTGWLPGEATIERLRARRVRPSPRRDRARLQPPHTRPATAQSRIVICFSLANRPPPVLLHP